MHSINENQGKIKGNPEFVEEYEEFDLKELPKDYGGEGKGIRGFHPVLFYKENEKTILVTLIFIFGFSGAFALGKISEKHSKREPVRVLNSNVLPSQTPVALPLKSPLSKSAPKPESQAAAPVLASPASSSGTVVVSKNGTKYHYPFCPGAKSISEANKIWFSSTEEARKAGYTPASNCKGLK